MTQVVHPEREAEVQLRDRGLEDPLVPVVSVDPAASWGRKSGPGVVVNRSRNSGSIGTSRGTWVLVSSMWRRSPLRSRSDWSSQMLGHETSGMAIHYQHDADGRLTTLADRVSTRVVGSLVTEETKDRDRGMKELLTDHVLGFIPSPTGVYLVTDYVADYGRSEAQTWRRTIHQENTDDDRCNHVSRMHATRDNHPTMTGEEVEALWKRVAAMPAQEDERVPGKYWPPLVDGDGFDRCTQFHRESRPAAHTTRRTRRASAPELEAPLAACRNSTRSAAGRAAAPRRSRDHERGAHRDRPACRYALCSVPLADRQSPEAAPRGVQLRCNRRRLWSGLRTGDAPGMTCHPTDPENQPVKEAVRTRECTGAWLLLLREMAALEASAGLADYRRGRSWR